MNRERWFKTRLKIRLKNSRNILEWPRTKLWSTCRYASHSEFTIKKPERQNFYRKTKILDMKIQIQISPTTCPALINSRKHECKSCQPKQKTRRKLHKKVFERIKESKWGTSCKYLLIKHPWYTNELARTLFPVGVESIKNIKIKWTTELEAYNIPSSHMHSSPTTYKL